MIERYMTQTKSRARLEAGPMASLFPAFISELEERRYSPESIQRMIRTADCLGRWLKDQGIDLVQANQAQVDQFVLAQGRHLDKRSQRGHLPKSASHITTVTALLRKQGILKGRSNWTDIDVWANRFSTHLLQIRGATKFTKDNYVRYARRLMISLNTSGKPDWTTLDAERICRFVQNESMKLSLNCRTQLVTAVRSFLRFLQSEGAVRPNLANAIPPVRTCRHADIPRHLKPEQLQRLIAVCLEPNVASRRDRAMVLMMARLGMRVGEVRQLRLDDIDWREGTVHVRSGKARTERVLPLPEDVGQAVVVYLREERPESQHRQIFLRTEAPFQGLSWSSGICRIAKRLLKHAGVEGPRLAAHCLRHSVATQMVRGGASFQQAADVLGHKALQSTGIYAKLDDQSLLQVALPWPGGAE